MAAKNAASQLCPSVRSGSLKSWNAGKLWSTQWYFRVLVACQPLSVHTTHHKQLLRICSMHVQCSTLVSLIMAESHGIRCCCRFSTCHILSLSTKFSNSLQETQLWSLDLHPAISNLALPSGLLLSDADDRVPQPLALKMAFASTGKLHYFKMFPGEKKW